MSDTSENEPTQGAGEALPREVDWAPIQAAYQETTESLDDLAARFRVSKSAISWRARRSGWIMRNRPAGTSGPALIVRIYRLLERQLVQMERTEGPMSDKDAAILVRIATTVNRLIEVEGKAPRSHRETPRMNQAKCSRSGRPLPDDSNNSEISERLAAALSDKQAREIFYCWPAMARNEQWPPKSDWTSWLLIGGRGSGKTRAGAEWIRRLAWRKVNPLVLVGETITEAIEVMVKGPSGVLRVHPPEERPRLRGHTLIWENGVEAAILGASDPERFRGPQFAAAWCDELGKWPKAEAAWDMLQFGLRLGG